MRLLSSSTILRSSSLDAEPEGIGLHVSTSVYVSRPLRSDTQAGYAYRRMVLEAFAANIHTTVLCHFQYTLMLSVLYSLHHPQSSLDLQPHSHHTR